MSDFRASDFLYTGGGFYDRINWNERAEGAENLDSGNCSANCNTQNGNPDIQTELLWLHHASTRTGSSTSLLKLLLQDKTTGRNILWGTDACADRGGLYRQDQQIRPELITGPNSDIIRTRAEKAADQQAARTRQHAEVFTPLWVCDRMNNDLDTVWFRTPGKFRNNGQPTERVRFTKKHRWTTCVDSRRLEITCGEAPYQDESNGESRNYAPPIYNLFMDASYEVGDAVELIHPAGFLFNAGSTWRISMTIPRTRCFWRSPASQKKISASCATAETANFVEADAAEAAKAGTLAQLVDEKFG